MRGGIFLMLLGGRAPEDWHSLDIESDVVYCYCNQGGTMTAPITIDYSYRFQNGSTKTFKLLLEGETLQAIKPYFSVYL
jgi:hypothetical protein